MLYCTIGFMALLLGCAHCTVQCTEGSTADKLACLEEKLQMEVSMLSCGAAALYSSVQQPAQQGEWGETLGWSIFVGSTSRRKHERTCVRRLSTEASVILTYQLLLAPR